MEKRISFYVTERGELNAAAECIGSIVDNGTTSLVSFMWLVNTEKEFREQVAKLIETLPSILVPLSESLGRDFVLLFQKHGFSGPHVKWYYPEEQPC